MDDLTLLYTVMFAALLLLVAYVLYRAMRLSCRERDDGVDLAVRKVPRPRYQFRTGGTYLLDSGDAQEGLKAFKGQLSAGDQGLFISRTYPEMACKRHRLGDTRCVWLSRNEEKGGTNPTKLGPLLEEIEEFIEGNSRPFVFIADLDYLVEENDFKRFFSFVKGLREVAETGAGRVLVSGRLLGLRKQEREQVHREIKVLEPRPGAGGRNNGRDNPR